LYSLLIDSGVLDSSIQIRCAECLIAANEFNAAVGILEPLQQTHSIGDWGLRSLALAYSGLGKLELAASILAEIIERNPSNIHYLRFRLRLLCQLGDRHGIARLMQIAETNLGKKEYEDFRIAGLVQCADYTALLELFRNNPGYGSAAIERDLISAVSGAVHQKKEFQAAAGLALYFLSRFGKNVKVLLSLMSAAFATRNWHFAKLCVATASEQDFESNLELRLKRFEFYCFTGALGQAQAALKELEPLSELPRKRLSAVLRYYAEIGDWSALYKLGMESLDAEFNFERSGYLIFRAVRKTGMHMEAKRQIERINEFGSIPALKRLRTIIIEDMIQNNHMLEDLIGDPHLADLPALQQRLLFKKLVLRKRKKCRTDPKRFAIYYCTNISYLGPTLVSLASLIENNRYLVETSDVFLVTDSGSRELAKAMSAKVSKKYQVDVQLAEFAGSDMDFKAKYGLFTAGQSLVPAAYYRIYFAKELQQRGRYEGALYIDSDTIVRASLHEMFETRALLPLMARLEMPRPEVDIAIAMNDLEPGRYFNSGVLFFDLRHSAIGSALDKTIHAVQHSSETLVYHDQCALNIGFKGQFFPLEAKFNHFVKPEDEGQVSDGTIIHFLDRPKPWDPAYSGKSCGLWFAHWHKLAMKIGTGEAMKLYNLSNRE
jgi:lipopolysaccharide biosynthesis glycosyltransferase